MGSEQRPWVTVFWDIPSSLGKSEEKLFSGDIVRRVFSGWY